jgi:hypothetical protein
LQLSKAFWAKAIAMACCIQNQSYTTTLTSFTPYEAWFGHNPIFFHLQIFGCPTFDHVLHEKKPT